VTFLSAKALDFRHGHTVDAGHGKGFTNFIQLIWFDYCGYKFHGLVLLPGSIRSLSVAFVVIEPFIGALRFGE
jgi:hypothetical protein